MGGAGGKIAKHIIFIIVVGWVVVVGGRWRGVGAVGQYKKQIVFVMNAWGVW